MDQLVAAKQELHVEPLLESYAEAPIVEAFDWPQIIKNAKQRRPLEESTPLYLVAFRSQLKEGADTTDLFRHDANAHAAALESPELIHYFADTPDSQGKSLSFCLWSDRNEARRISQDSRHAAAIQMVALYASYALEKYDVYHDDQSVTFVTHQ